MMILFRLFLTGALLGVSAMGSAQAVPTAPKSAQFSKVVLNPDIPKASQRVKVGTICLFGGAPLDFGTTERTLSNERFERLFAATMTERGFHVVAKSADLFEGESSGPEASFLIAATIRPTSVDVCDSVDGIKGSIAISVEWKIYDRSQKQVVETVTTDGVGRQEKFTHSGLMGVIDQGFAASLKALIDQKVMQKYLGSPVTKEPASAPIAPIQG